VAGTDRQNFRKRQAGAKIARSFSMFVTSAIIMALAFAALVLRRLFKDMEEEKTFRSSLRGLAPQAPLNTAILSKMAAGNS
jgi:hypothetical protein